MQVTPVPVDFVNGPLSLTFEWTPLPEHGRARPYYVHLKITDDPVDPELNPSVTYKTWVLSFQALPDVITGLEEEDRHLKLQFYPNPTDKILKWELAGEENYKSLVIYNSIGQQTIFLDLSSSKLKELDISDLSSGLYFAHLYAQMGKYSGKFIKQ